MTSYHPAYTSPRRGFALLIAVIFMSVMLSFGLTLGSLGYKQQVLASSALESQYAFYAADAGLECALYADQQLRLFEYNANLNAPAPSMSCDNAAPISTTKLSHTATRWVFVSRVSLDGGTRCADVTISKPAPNQGTSYLFSQGYNVACSVVASPSGARYVSRGLDARY